MCTGVRARGDVRSAKPHETAAERGDHVVKTRILIQLQTRGRRIEEGKKKKKERGVDKILVRKKIGLAVPFWP